MELTKIAVTIDFISYIAHPYWPEREMVIRIGKDSGMARQKTDEKREAALKTQLKKINMTWEEYLELEKRAKREWYRDNPIDDLSEIVIPRHQFSGALVQTVGDAPKVLRGKFTKDNFRSLVQIGDFKTGKFKCDGVFQRYVRMETSNMRFHQANEYIENFTATGILKTAEKVDGLKRLFETAVEMTGVGSSRKMGYGRGRIMSFKEIGEEISEEAA